MSHSDSEDITAHSDSEEFTASEHELLKEITGDVVEDKDSVETLLDQLKKKEKENEMLKNRVSQLKINNRLLLTMNENLRSYKPPNSFPGPVTLSPRKKSRYPVGGVRDAIFNHRRGSGYLRRAVKRKFRRRRNEV